MLDSAVELAELAVGHAQDVVAAEIEWMVRPGALTDHGQQELSVVARLARPSLGDQ
jgi:hypothetical protein